ncbi:hypothetical protein EVAR_3614_1 [Eumeta japonica]|uniref:Uncharacterized protein n=1 Tax=Eumeta variegata TaxID=151549 RepID=A0A4C1SZ50_EUMVA|nr:hypothetical protein EVAR_3614_1 [Eumeta japonica]
MYGSEGWVRQKENESRINAVEMRSVGSRYISTKKLECTLNTLCKSTATSRPIKDGSSPPPPCQDWNHPLVKRLGPPSCQEDWIRPCN